MVLSAFDGRALLLLLIIFALAGFLILMVRRQRQIHEERKQAFLQHRMDEGASVYLCRFRPEREKMSPVPGDLWMDAVTYEWRVFTRDKGWERV